MPRVFTAAQVASRPSPIRCADPQLQSAGVPEDLCARYPRKPLRELCESLQSKSGSWGQGPVIWKWAAQQPWRVLTGRFGIVSLGSWAWGKPESGKVMPARFTRLGLRRQTTNLNTRWQPAACPEVPKFEPALQVCHPSDLPGYPRAKALFHGALHVPPARNPRIAAHDWKPGTPGSRGRTGGSALPARAGFRFEPALGPRCALWKGVTSATLANQVNPRKNISDSHVACPPEALREFWQADAESGWLQSHPVLSEPCLRVFSLSLA